MTANKEEKYFVGSNSVDTSTNDPISTPNNNHITGNIDIRDVICDDRPLRIYLDGVFDLTHFGHYRLFKQIKDKFPNSCVVVGICSDEETRLYKSATGTIMNEKERAESIGHCKWVDEVLDAPWMCSLEFLEKHNIDYLAHDGDPYPSPASSSNVANDDIYAVFKEHGKFIATQRAENISTTDIINRVVRRYNEFILRNLQRGTSRKELNVTLWKEVRVVTDANIKKWMQNPSTLRKDFLKLFDRYEVVMQSPMKSMPVSRSRSSIELDQKLLEDEEMMVVSFPPTILKYSVITAFVGCMTCIMAYKYRSALKTT